MDARSPEEAVRPISYEETLRARYRGAAERLGVTPLIRSRMRDHYAIYRASSNDHYPKPKVSDPSRDRDAGPRIPGPRIPGPRFWRDVA
jgi:hypothetical protein